MEREEWVEKEVAAHPVPLDAHSRNTLRAMKRREFDYWEKEVVRVDNHTGRDDQ
jgi:hypothetical protein